jgi:6-phosphofructo-2-kinase / fructose-2,6-biphosphatase 2
MIYLKWLEYDVKVFNVGQLRRSRARQQAQKYDDYETRFESELPDERSHRGGVKEEHNASWFSHQNAQANQSREQLAQDSLEMLIQWLKDGGNVGIHGAHAMIYILEENELNVNRRDEQYAHAKVCLDWISAPIR